jgi:hypothetical protein
MFKNSQNFEILGSIYHILRTSCEFSLNIILGK